MAHRGLETDIVKRGYVHIKRPPCSGPKIRLKAWQKKYAVIRDISFDNNISTFEIYDSEDTFKSHGKPSYVLDLKNVSHVETYDESKCFSHGFMVLRNGRAPLTLACGGLIEKHSWIEAVRKLSEKRQLIYKYNGFDLASSKVAKERRPSLPERLNYTVNPIYDSSEQQCPGWVKDRGWSDSVPALLKPLRSTGPPTKPRTTSCSSCGSSDDDFTREFIDTKCGGVLVHIQQSTDALRNLLSGDYYMNVTGTDVTLTSVTSLKEVIKWPISQIQTFKSEDNDQKYQLVTLEAPAHCDKANGSYIFQTTHGLDLIDKVKDASSRSKSRVTCMRQVMTKQVSSNIHRHDSHCSELSQSTPELLSYGSEQEWFNSSETYTCSQGAAPYLELLASGVAVENSPLDYLVNLIPEPGDSGFDDSDDEKCSLPHNNSLDVFIPIANIQLNTAARVKQAGPPVPPRGYCTVNTAHN